jgi:hypothetical protein
LPAVPVNAAAHVGQQFATAQVPLEALALQDNRQVREKMSHRVVRIVKVVIQETLLVSMFLGIAHSSEKIHNGKAPKPPRREPEPRGSELDRTGANIK